SKRVNGKSQMNQKLIPKTAWMKRIRYFATLLACAVLLLGCSEQGPQVIKLATTTSTESSGLLDVLLPAFQRKTGIIVQVLPMGTGKALRTARDGNCDLVLVHAPKAEEQFVDQGWGVERRQIMYNDFVIVGPRGDPARIAGLSDAPAALARIAAAVAVLIAGFFGIYPPGFVAQVVAFAFGLAASSFFPIIVLGIFSKRTTKEGAIAGMLTGILFTGSYIIYFKFINPAANNAEHWWLGISPEGIGTLGMLANMAVTLVVTRFTPPPPQSVQDSVEAIRYPRKETQDVDYDI
ncbi:hypothetical protein LCGC14_2672740, partial [marine sediment metagenome]